MLLSQRVKLICSKSVERTAVGMMIKLYTSDETEGFKHEWDVQEPSETDLSETKKRKMIGASIRSKKQLANCYPPYNFSWFIENKIAAMGWPETIGNLNYIVDAGVTHLITLSPECMPPVSSFSKILKWTEITMDDFDAPTLRQVNKFVEICGIAETSGEVIGVHCRHGRGRTGTMLACYLVKMHGMSADVALKTVRAQRPNSCESYEQEDCILDYYNYLRSLEK